MQSCERYWTVGGQLRDVPRGSGRRKTKLRDRVQLHQLAQNMPLSESMIRQPALHAFLQTSPFPSGYYITWPFFTLSPAEPMGNPISTYPGAICCQKNPSHCCGGDQKSESTQGWPCVKK